MTSPAAAWALPALTPYQGPARCQTCGGGRSEGRLLLAARLGAGGTTVIVDALCPACRGCGRAAHDGCDPREHHDWTCDQTPDRVPAPGECPACHGRGWWVAQAGRHHLRIPCECARPHLITAAQRRQQ